MHPATKPSSSLPLPSVSSAPKVDDFVPPEPTPTDPYPGYYLLPSGTWAAYDPGYYQKFYKKWQAEYDAHVRALEKGQVRGFEDMDESQMGEVDAAAEMERAKVEVKLREERKALSWYRRPSPWWYVGVSMNRVVWKG